MRYLSTILFLLFCTVVLNAQYCKKKYKEKLEQDSKVIDCEGNYTIEKLKNGSCILKKYYPETKMITQLTTFKNDDLTERHGLFQQFWDDGTLVNQGQFQHNLKEGIWILNTYESGEFKNDEKVGVWKSIGSDSIVSQEKMYVDGELHGQQINYDSLGHITSEQEYEFGKLISTTLDTTINIVEEMPRFPGCEDLNLSKEELQKCAQDKLLKYVYSSLKYPTKSRSLNIQGKAFFQFVINEEGEIEDVKALNGISKDIQKEAFNLINKMPSWKPGTKDGKPVKVLFTLPINFKLK